jgi:hypothetical protein
MNRYEVLGHSDGTFDWKKNTEGAWMRTDEVLPCLDQQREMIEKLTAENQALRNLANNLQPGPISAALGGAQYEKPFREAAGFTAVRATIMAPEEYKDAPETADPEFSRVVEALATGFKLVDHGDHRDFDGADYWVEKREGFQLKISIDRLISLGVIESHPTHASGWVLGEKWRCAYMQSQAALGDGRLYVPE